MADVSSSSSGATDIEEIGAESVVKLARLAKRLEPKRSRQPLSILR